MSRTTLVTWSIASASSLAVTAWLMRPMWDFPLLGWDTYPLILAARIESLGDLLGTFTEEHSDGVYPYSFYRPVLNFSLALDYALQGIEPQGFLLGNARAFLVCALATFALARRWLGPGATLGPFVALGAFLIQPVHAEVLPVPARRVDLICGGFVALALWAELGRGTRAGVRARALPALCTALAVGAKEAGVVALPLVFLLGWIRSPEPALLARLRQAAHRALPHALALSAVFVARFAAIGGLGGHRTTDLLGTVTRLPESASAITQRLSHLRVFEKQLHEGAGAQAIGIVVVLLGVSALVALVSRPGGAEPSRRGRAVSLALLTLPWLVGLAAIYGAVGILQPWYLLLPAQAACLLAGAGAEVVAAALRGRQWCRAAVIACPVVIWLGFTFAWSPLVRPLSHWPRAAAVLSRYEAELAREIARSPNGNVLYVRKPRPFVAPDPSPIVSMPAAVINAYALPSWVALHFPERRIEVSAEAADPKTREPIADGLRIVLRQRAR